MIQLTDATFIVNDEPVATIPNTTAFTEGLGEQSMKAASIGGGAVEQIYANDLETNFAMVKTEIPSTPENIELVKTWKNNRNQNVVQIIGETPEGTLTRTFAQAALTSDYEVGIGTDATIPVDFKSSQAI